MRDRTPKSSLAKAAAYPSRRACAAQSRSTSIAVAIDDRDIVKINLFHAFLRLYLPAGEDGKVQGQRSPVSWFLIVPDLLPPSDLLSCTLTSLSMARLGREQGDHYRSMQSRVLFGTALRKLQAALNNRALVYRDETLAACHACTIFEVYSTSPSTTYSRIPGP